MVCIVHAHLYTFLLHGMFIITLLSFVFNFSRTQNSKNTFIKFEKPLKPQTHGGQVRPLQPGSASLSRPRDS